MAVGVYPGTFNPPTVAHLAIAEAAVAHGRLRCLDLALSESPLGKEALEVPSLEDRLRVLEDVAASRPWLRVRRTRARLIAEIAAGYDLLVVGADKWAQMLDPAWYGGSAAARDRALAGLPAVLVVPRPPGRTRRARATTTGSSGSRTSTPAVSSTAVRSGRTTWMLPEAAAFDARTGAWSDPQRYLNGRSGGRDSPGPAE